MISDFFFAAWPWIAIGLIVAIVLAALGRSKGGEDADKAKAGERKALAFYISASLAFFTAVVMLLADDSMHGNFVTWMSIGSMMLCIGAAQTFKNNSNK